LAADRLGLGKVGSKRRVLFDSSFLIAVMESPTSWQSDLLEKLGMYEGVIIGPVYDELGLLANGKGRSSRYASLAKGLADSGTLKLERSPGNRADEELASKALDDGAFVATIDLDLTKQLEASGIRVITLRNGRVEMKSAIS